jgi:hypothetical protein
MPINLHDDVVAWGIISIISIPGTYQYVPRVVLDDHE